MEKLKFDFQYLAVCHTCKDVLGFYVKILLWKKKKKKLWLLENPFVHYCVSDTG